MQKCNFAWMFFQSMFEDLFCFVQFTCIMCVWYLCNAKLVWMLQSMLAHLLKFLKSIYMYVCMHVCIYASTQVYQFHVYVCMHVCMFVKFGMGASSSIHAVAHLYVCIQFTYCKHAYIECMYPGTHCTLT